MAKKINFLKLISTMNLSSKDIASEIIAQMEIDRDLAEFVIEQSKFVLFITTGNGKPNETELVNACMNTIIGITLKLDGAIFGYQYFLDHGLTEYLEFMRLALFDEDFEKKVG